MSRIGFIGAGNMGGALIVASCNSIDPKDVVITDYITEKAEELSRKTGCQVASTNKDIVDSAEYIVLAVKPNVIRDVTREIAPTLAACQKEGQRKILVSIAAGVSISSLEECLESEIPIIRIMPNTPAMVGQGMLLLTSSDANPAKVTEDMFAELISLLRAAGDFERIKEDDFDITTSISGCTPAYVYMFIEGLADGAVQVGVPRALAMKLAAKTVLGSAAMVLETGQHPGALKDAVCSPGGSTIVGVSALEEHGFRYAAAQSIIKSTERNLELG